VIQKLGGINLNIQLHTPDKKPVQILSITDGLRTVVVTNISGANVYLEKDDDRVNKVDGFILPAAQAFSPNSAWKGNLFGACDIEGGQITVLISDELTA